MKGLDLSRRTLLGLAGGALMIRSSGVLAIGNPGPHLVIYDGRLPAAAGFAGRADAEGLRLFDIAGQDAVAWRGARNGFGLAAAATVVGCTSWSSFVDLRGLLGERGLRVTEEVPLDRVGEAIANVYDHLAWGKAGPVLAERPAVGRAALFAWRMVPRVECCPSHRSRTA
jgi:hypothetical protein